MKEWHQIRSLLTPTFGPIRLRRYARPIIAIISAGLVIALGASYGLSYQSVRGLTVEIAQVSRTSSVFGHGAPAIEFDVEAHVWSSNSLDTSIDQVRFELTVDNILFPTTYARSSTFSPHGYLQYNLSFVDTNWQEATSLFTQTSHRITLSITTLTSAGLYSASLSPASSRTITISRVADTTISSSVLSDCRPHSQLIGLPHGGGTTIQVSSMPDTVSVYIYDSKGSEVFSQSGAILSDTIRLTPDTYFAVLNRLGSDSTCAGSDQVSGSLAFWHEEASLARSA